MVKWLIPLLLIILGACVSAGGLLYGVITVGVPTPHAPASVAAQEARDVNLSSGFVVAGAVVALLGAFGVAVVGVVARRRASASDPKRRAT